jgi:hypothetical protein
MSAAAGMRSQRRTCHLALGLMAIALCTACGRAPTSRAATPTPSTAAPLIPTPPPAGPLTWTPHVPPVAAPAGANQTPALAVAQSNGNTAYMCAPTGASSPTGVSVWLTRDRGASWAPTARMTVNSGQAVKVAACALVVDDNQPGTVIVRAGVLPAGGCFPYVDCVNYVPYVTMDFGAHWAPLHGPLGYPFELATRGRVTYALFGSPPRSASRGATNFVQSVDGMRTWTTIAIPSVGDGSVAGPIQEQVLAFWLNPLSGALLVMNTNSVFNDEHFWSSTDVTHWTQLNAPPFPFAVFDIVVQQPFTNAPWRICGGDSSNWYVNGQSNTHIKDIACTVDGGAHWIMCHLDFTLNGAGLPDYTLVTIADDGDLLFTTSSGLERFAIGPGGVDSLGPVPNAGAAVYAASGGNGVLWAGPANNFQDPDAQGRVFTASYA